MLSSDWSSDGCSSDLIVSHLGANTGAAADVALKDPRPPKFDAEDLYALIPDDVRAPYDVKEVIARLVDGSEFHEFKAHYGSTLVCGFAHIWGKIGRPWWREGGCHDG